jgi:hypothetical protein
VVVVIHKVRSKNGIRNYAPERPTSQEVNPLVLLLVLPSKVQPKYSFGNDHSTLQLLSARCGGEGICVQPHNLAFSQFRLKARIWH